MPSTAALARWPAPAGAVAPGRAVSAAFRSALSSVAFFAVSLAARASTAVRAAPGWADGLPWPLPRAMVPAWGSVRGATPRVAAGGGDCCDATRATSALP